MSPSNLKNDITTLPLFIWSELSLPEVVL